MKRRAFLTIAGIGGAIAAVASGRFFTMTFERAVEDLIRSELPFLNLDQAGLTSFANEYSKFQNQKFKSIVKGYSLLGISASQSGKIHTIVSTYLLSSDFFINNMDEKRVVRYIALFDPYRRPCTHPFSHLHYPDRTTSVPKV